MLRMALPCVAQGGVGEADTVIRVGQAYESALGAAQTFLRVLVNRCATKTDANDQRPILEHIVDDLLLTCGLPEWPASETLLLLLCRLLVTLLARPSGARVANDTAVRSIALDTLSSILGQLRRFKRTIGRTLTVRCARRR